MARRLHVCRARRMPRRLDGGVETERHVKERDVVVDCLRYAHHGDLQFPSPYLLDDRMCTAQRAIAPDGEQQLDSEPLKRVHHFIDRLRAAGRAQDRTADFVDLTYSAGRQFDRRQCGPLDKTLEAELEAVNRCNAVFFVQAEDDGANDVIQARTEPATRDDPAPQIGGIEVDPFPRPRQLEGRRIDAGPELRAQLIDIGAEQEPFRCIHEPRRAQRRDDLAFA